MNPGADGKQPVSTDHTRQLTWFAILAPGDLTPVSGLHRHLRSRAWTHTHDFKESKESTKHRQSPLEVNIGGAWRR